MPDASSSSTIFSVSNAITAAYSFATSGSFISRAAHGPIPTRPCASGCLSGTAGWCHDTRKLEALRTRIVTPTIDDAAARDERRSTVREVPKRLGIVPKPKSIGTALTSAIKMSFNFGNGGMSYLSLSSALEPASRP